MACIEERIQKLEDKVFKLESDSEIFGEGFERVKIYEVMYKLLDELGYKLIGKEIKFERK